MGYFVAAVSTTIPPITATSANHIEEKVKQELNLYYSAHPFYSFELEIEKSQVCYDMWLLYIHLSKDMTAWVDLKALLE